ncbi:hypothetical protein Tco_0644996 [Tanacetum coccineum]
MLPVLIIPVTPSLIGMLFLWQQRKVYNADIRATNILLQGLPKDIYTLINHYTDAKDIWDNVKMLLEGSELTKEDRESQLYDDFEHFRPETKDETYFMTTIDNWLPGEAHANENKMMLDRFTQHTVYPLALMSNVSHPQYHSLSSTTLPSTYVTPHFADNTQPDTGISPTDKLNKSILTIHFALLHPNHTKKTYLKQTNTLKTSLLKTRNQATVQVRQGYGSNVQGRQNKGQGNNPLGGGATGYGGAQNRVGNTNPGQARQIKCYNYNAQRNGVGGIACKRLLLFLAAWTRRQLLLRLCYEHTDHDLALNVDNVFQVNDCDAFDSDVDEAPMAQTMFMANLSSADPVYDEAGPSYDSDILSECQLYRGNASLFQMMHIMIYNDMNKLNILERRARFELMEQEQKIDETIKEYFWSSQLASSSSTPSPTRFISLQDTATPSSLKTSASAEYTAWTTTDTRLKPSVSSIPLPHEDLHMDDDTAPDEQVHSSGDEDIGHDHIPTVNLKQNWWKPLTEDNPATPEPAWSIPSSDLHVPMNNWASALASTYATPENSLLAQTGDMAIFMDWFLQEARDH